MKQFGTIDQSIDIKFDWSKKIKTSNDDIAGNGSFKWF